MATTTRAARVPRIGAVLREGEQVKPLELFFDLVFVLAITQCTTLMSHDPTWSGLAQGMLVLGVPWWSRFGYAWLTSVVARAGPLRRATWHDHHHRAGRIDRRHRGRRARSPHGRHRRRGGARDRAGCGPVVDLLRCRRARLRTAAGPRRRGPRPERARPRL